MNQTISEMLAYGGHKKTRADIAQDLMDAAALLLATCQEDCANDKCSHCAQAIEYVRSVTDKATQALIAEWRHARGVVITLPTVPASDAHYSPEKVMRQRPTMARCETIDGIAI